MDKENEIPWEIIMGTALAITEDIGKPFVTAEQLLNLSKDNGRDVVNKLLTECERLRMENVNLRRKLRISDNLA